MLSVVIPALNEEAAILETVEAIRASLAAARIEHEIIVVNDGSRDSTGQRAAESAARVVTHPKQGGYGLSLKDGIAAARYDVIAISDADGTYPSERLAELYRHLCEQGFDMVVGARQGTEYQGTFLKMPARRVFLWLSEYATGTKIPDINSGLRVFRKSLALRYLHTISNGFSFTTTITLAALLNGHFVDYVPIDYFKRKGASHVLYSRDTLRALQIITESILYYNPLKLFLLVTILLVVVGVVAAAGAFLVPASRISGILTVLAGASIPAAFVVAAVGLLADLNRMLGLAREPRLTGKSAANASVAIAGPPVTPSLTRRETETS